MNGTFSVRWHSRAGQGAITAANAFAEILGMKGKSVQSFPEFGAEKRGAPVVVFNRVSDELLTDYSQPTAPDLVILLDSALVANCEVSPPEILAGLKIDGKLLVNTAQKKIAFAEDWKNVYALDASRIAVETIGKDIPNVPILGALVRLSELSELTEFQTALAEYLSQTLPKPVVEGNLKAFERGYNEVKFLMTNFSPSGTSNF